MWHRDKFSSGLKVAPVLNLARAKNLLLFALIASFCHFLWRFRCLGQCRNVCGTDFDLEEVEILAKMMQNSKKKQMFDTGLNLALVLLLVQS